MSTRLLFLLLLLSVSGAFAQPAEYNKYVQQATAFYEAKEYAKAGECYTKAFASFNGKGMIDDRYNAACVWAKAGNADSAFSQLDRIATKGNFTGYTMLIRDEDLSTIRADKRWPVIIDQVKQNKEKSETNLNKALVATLDTIFNDDQDGRQQSERVRKKYGPNSAEIKKLWQSINTKDSIDLIKVKKIIDQYGWPGSDIAGAQGSETVFLVIQHADIATQEHYLPMMREAVKNKKAQASALALLEDRVALRQGKKQTYGSQVRSGANGEMWVSPLEDPDNVDKRRAEVGLGPLAEYLQNWNIKWDPVAYKKQLPEIERKEKAN